MKGHIQSEERTREIIRKASGSKAEISILVGNETADCKPVPATANVGAVVSSPIRQELLYITGVLLIMMTIGLVTTVVLLINRRGRSVSRSQPRMLRHQHEDKDSINSY